MSTDSLVPPLDWVDDPNSDEYDAPCPVCSALVESRAVHRAWHQAIADLARRYVDAPRYFDHTLDELGAALDAAANGGDTP